MGAVPQILLKSQTSALCKSIAERGSLLGFFVPEVGKRHWVCTTKPYIGGQISFDGHKWSSTGRALISAIQKFVVLTLDPAAALSQLGLLLGL